MSVTSSDFPNRETFVRREEFCLTLLKLKRWVDGHIHSNENISAIPLFFRTCSSEKRTFLEAKFPSVCVGMEDLQNRILASSNDSSVICQDMRHTAFYSLN